MGICSDLTRALSLLPSAPAVMTAAFEHKRGGILVTRAMVCADEPPCVALSVPKGHRLATLVRDSHAFCLNLIDPKQRLLIKKFEHGAEPDTFELLEHRSLATGAPCLARSLACLDCEVMRHFDLEADHEMYIGLVMAAWVPVAQPAGSGLPARAACTNGHAVGSGAGLHGHGGGVAVGAGGGGLAVAAGAA